MHRLETIESACELVTDGTHYTPKDVGEGIPFLTVRDVSNSGLDFSGCSFITESDYVKAAYGNCAPMKGDVLFSKDGTVGKVHVVVTDRPFAVLSSLAILRPKMDSVDSTYLGHALRSPATLNEALKKKTGSAIRRIILSDLKKVRIYLPPISEQRRIAAILDQADALRAKRRETLAQLDSLSQSIFIEKFGDPISNPKKWPILPFSEVCETRLGKMLDARQQTGQDKRRYLRNANVQWFQIDLFDLLEMDFDLSARMTFNLQKGDLLICEGGEPGRSAVWQGQLDDIYFQKALHRGRPKAGVAISEYIVWLLWFLAHNGGLGDHVTAATIAHLTGEKLKAMPIPVPPIEIQKAFAEQIESIDALKATHIEALAELDNLFASLQHRAFQGEL